MIIGISGKMQSGKDTVADYLVKKYKFKRVAFADKLKEIAKDLFFWNGDKDNYGRKLLQDIGMKMREVKTDVWVNYILRTLNNEDNREKDYIITDVRFMNEYELVKLGGNYMWRINRDIKREGDVNNHQSEIDLDNVTDFDAVIDNNGTLAELYAKVDILISERRK